MSDDNESVLIKLTRMEGKLDMSNLRHDQHDERFRSLDARISGHGTRIVSLETQRNINDGERKGLALSGKFIWAMVGAVPIGVGAAVLRMLGA